MGVLQSRWNRKNLLQYRHWNFNAICILVILTHWVQIKPTKSLSYSNIYFVCSSTIYRLKADSMYNALLDTCFPVKYTSPSSGLVWFKLVFPAELPSLSPTTEFDSSLSINFHAHFCSLLTVRESCVYWCRKFILCRYRLFQWIYKYVSVLYGLRSKVISG